MIKAQMMLGAVLLALIVVVVTNMVGDALMRPGAEPQAAHNRPEHQPAQTSVAASGGGIAALLKAADPAKGQAEAKKCAACHSFEPGAPAKVGPNLSGVVGRPKASAPGFAYSDALKGKGGAWSYGDLDAFIAKPSAFAPGTKMTFAGVPDAKERADIIAYLRSLSPNAPPP
jgi:cytochrome c